MDSSASRRSAGDLDCQYAKSVPCWLVFTFRTWVLSIRSMESLVHVWATEGQICTTLLIVLVPATSMKDNSAAVITRQCDSTAIGSAGRSSVLSELSGGMVGSADRDSLCAGSRAGRTRPASQRLSAVAAAATIPTRPK